MLFRRLLIVFQNRIYQNILSGIPPECQTVCIQIRFDGLSGLLSADDFEKVKS